jgi:hypothetical protein
VVNGVKAFFVSFFCKKRRSQVAAVSEESSIETNILTDLKYLLQISRASFKLITDKQQGN